LLPAFFGGGLKKQRRSHQSEPDAAKSQVKNAVGLQNRINSPVSDVVAQLRPASRWFKQFRKGPQAIDMNIRLHRGDLPNLDRYGDSAAIDTETLGLNPLRDRLCVVQLSPGDGTADVVQIEKGQTSAPNLEKLLADPMRLKIFHFARFDIAVLAHAFGVMAGPVYCTKIASRLTRTYTDRHGLKDLARDLVGIDMSKQQQSSDWAAAELSPAQLEYAASDVLYLHQMKAKLDERLVREGRTELAQAAFDYLPWRARLDLAGWPDQDIFSHS
jgi:ribonuclease D